MSSLSVTILGSSSALPTSERYPTAHLVSHDERFFLLDCGEGTQMQLRRYRKKFTSINHVFISHLHGDHVFGLFGLISSFSLLGRKNDLHIYSNPLLEEIILSHLNFFDQALTYKIIFHPINAKESELIYEDKKLTVTTIPLKHRIPCVGFLFKEKEKNRNIKKEMIARYQIGVADIGKIKKGEDFVLSDGGIVLNSELTTLPPKPLSYAFCTDTLYHESIISHLKNVDLLYFETTFMNEELNLAKKTYHSTTIQAATIAQKANVGKLVIGHFSSRYKNLNAMLLETQSIFPKSYLAMEGDEFIVE